MHIFLCSAEYKGTDDFREKCKRYPLILFSRELDIEKAIEETTEFLRERGWEELEVEKIKINDQDRLDTDDEILKNAFNDAKIKGIGVVVYTDQMS